MLTLADLTTPQTASTIRARIIARLQAAGVPTDDWAPSDAGGVENSRVDMLAAALSEILGQRIADITSGRFVETGTGAWLTYYAQKFYDLTRNLATRTIQNVWLTSLSTASDYDFAPDEVVVKSEATGNNYRNLDRIVLPPGKTLKGIRFQAEFPGSSFADAEGSITRMVTAPAGVSCINKPEKDFTDAKVTGNSTGKISGVFATKTVVDQSLGKQGSSGSGVTTIVPIRPSFKSIRFRIDAFGEIGSGSFSYSIDGAEWVSGGVISTKFELPISGGPIFTFTNGVAPSFIQQDIFTLLVADAILQNGTDEESDESLRTRCRARWSTLSDVATEGTIALWAQLASPEVDKVIVDADPNTPGGILVVVASHAGPASAAAVLAVQDFISARLHYKGVPAATGFTSPEERALVTSATARPITPAGIVDVKRDQLSSVQVAAEKNWQAYLRTLPIGGIVRLAELEQAVMDAGAQDFQGATLNGSAANLQLAHGEVATEAVALLTALTWRPA